MALSDDFIDKILSFPVKMFDDEIREEYSPLWDFEVPPPLPLSPTPAPSPVQFALEFEDYDDFVANSRCTSALVDLDSSELDLPDPDDSIIINW